MSLEKIAFAKRDKGFKKPDLIIYCVLALVIAAMFLSLFLGGKNGALTGVRVDVRYEKVFEYDFGNGKYSVYDENAVSVEDDGSVLSVKVECGGGYNLLEIDRNDRSVKVTDSDCRGRDCVHTAAVKDNNGIIFCSPHALRVVPYDFKTQDDEYILF